MKKIITVLLAMTMLLSLMACATESTKKKPENEVESQEGKLWDKKDYDFDGESFVVLGKAKSGSIGG